MVGKLATVQGMVLGCSAQACPYGRLGERGPDLRAPRLTLSDRAEILLEGLGWLRIQISGKDF